MDKPTASFDADAHAAEIRDQGFTVIRDFMAPDAIAEFRERLQPFLGSHRGRNDFEGFETERVYTLVARAKVFEDLACDPRLMALLSRFLEGNFLLSASHAINLMPGETAQGIHTDDGFYRQPRSSPAVGYSVIGAIDAFTAANGATEVIPGSHLWTEADIAARRAEPGGLEKYLVPMEVPAGAAFVFPGKLLHRGGANTTDQPRLAFTNQYCAGWARPQENFFLSVPKEIVRAMSPRAQALLGYELWPTFMGMATASHPAKSLEPGWVPPIVAQAPRA
ncbi:phytanoyl-CoA dioxygenase family protein [Phenylobacterium sp.]|jgi:ectoine hydroxylase-related dioxygenase (phytanoyl-CoA dioxygenase family)|uniref:phytanoyl-CoA dioxygenase family protein n=1 Tax=Phenylobacterium sp. TaxID=1871053 RepID=UPI002E303DC4|nr:phytanoyl-CoA dioxygenase family protein [Phenylobacterium sp.]HEX3364301.1 phytanoyl-CoA dioxygenase family protein [Phenylobacterium sp.]